MWLGSGTFTAHLLSLLQSSHCDRVTCKSFRNVVAMNKGWRWVSNISSMKACFFEHLVLWTPGSVTGVLCPSVIRLREIFNAPRQPVYDADWRGKPLTTLLYSVCSSWISGTYAEHLLYCHLLSQSPKLSHFVCLQMNVRIVYSR